MICIYGSKTEWTRSLYAVVSRSLGNKISAKDSESWNEYLGRVLPQLVRSMPGVELEQMGFDEDHMHFVIGIPPKYAIEDVMGELKTQSASLLREKFDFLKKVYWKEKIV